MDDGGYALDGFFETRPGGEIDADVLDRCQLLGCTFAGSGGNNVVTPAGQLADQPASEGSAGAGDKYSQSQLRTTVRLCSRMYCRRYQGPPPPPPDVPERFHPPNDWTSGQAPVVAPARRFT